MGACDPCAVGPSFNDTFADCYEIFSQDHRSFSIPSVCHVYLPDNTEDYECLSIIEPAPELGSKVWTRFGKRILIGVYRDEGRATERRLRNLVSWTRSVNLVTMTDTLPHNMVVGDWVDVYNTNIVEARVQVTAVPSALSFTVPSIASGAGSGSSGGFSPINPVNFFEERLVFRFLPSYRLVPWACVQELLASCQPSFGFAPVGLTDITTGDVVNTQRTVFNTRGLAPNGSPQGGERNRQQFDENGKPLSWTYDTLGQPTPTRTVSSKLQNNPPTFNQPVVNEHTTVDPDPAANTQLYIKDYYGYEVNDLARGQYHQDDLVFYDPDSENGISRQMNGSNALYPGPLHDDYGNFVIAALPNNTLEVRAPILPLQVDQYNHPYKAPQPRTSTS